MNHKLGIIDHGLRFIGYIFVFMILYSLFLIPRLAHAQVIATGVEQRAWKIDAETAKRGITLSNQGERVRVALLPDVAQVGTRIELTTYASPYYVEGPGVRRITPIYRVVFNPHPLQLASEHPLPKGEGRVREIPIAIQHHGENLGKKSLWIWNDNDSWSEISAQSISEKNIVRAKISAGTTYLAVFADNQVLEKGLASWYKYKNCHCAASPDYPKGTQLRVTNTENGQWVDVKVNDFGPDRAVHPDRVIDLDRAAFEHLDSPSRGVIKVKVEQR